VTAGLRLGAPGIYIAPVRDAEDGLRPVRLDVTGFVGVSLRGPVDFPVAVASWTDFVARFGGIINPTDITPTDPQGRPGPGLLPYAVQAFFAQGGVKAWVSRVGPVAPDPSATAQFRVGGTSATLNAASEGSWGRLLDVAFEFDVMQSFRRAAAVPAVVAPGELALPDGLALPVGSLLRVRGSERAPAGTLHWVTEVSLRAIAGGGQLLAAVLEPPLPDDPAADEIGVVTGTLVVTDRDPTFPRAESITGLGLHPSHPRYPARILDDRSTATALGDRCPVKVLDDESLLVRVGDGWTGPLPPADGLLLSISVHYVHDTGRDRFAGIGARSFFDDDDADADPLNERADHRGGDLIGRVDELGLLCVPDLTWSWTDPVAVTDPPDRPPASGCFRPCVADPSPTSYVRPPPPPPQLDARVPDELAEIIRRQLRLADVAAFQHRFVTLLDVPSGLPVGEIARWRARFDSSYLAAYHPWLGVPAQSPGWPAVFVPPSAFAAGIVAKRETSLGLPWGPANELAVSAVTAADIVTAAIHDQLHLLGVNVFRGERDGFRLSAARTLSSDPSYRQLSVRRLMTMIALTLERQSQWLVFEPNTVALRAVLTHSLSQFLGDLFRRGAFAGDTEEQSFFVRCDDALNPPESQALGRLIAEVGVAPVSPLEYLILRISQDTDGGVQVSS
jgi:hypothetical protein